MMGEDAQRSSRRGVAEDSEFRVTYWKRGRLDWIAHVALTGEWPYLYACTEKGIIRKVRKWQRRTAEAEALEKATRRTLS